MESTNEGGNLLEIIDLAHSLRQEHLFITNEQHTFLKLNEMLIKNSSSVSQLSWICAQHRQNLNRLIISRPDTGPSTCCQRAHSLENTKFVDAYKANGLKYQHVLAYVDLFNFLHRSPYLLAQSLSIGDRLTHISSDQMNSVVHTIATGLYGNSILSKDVDMVLRLLRELIEIQIVVSDNPRRMLRHGSCAFSRLYHRLHESLFSAKLFLTAALHEPVMRVLIGGEVMLDIDPVKAVSYYSQKERLKKFGIEGTPEYEEKFQKYQKDTINSLFNLSNLFIQSLSDNWALFPSTLRWVVQTMCHLLKIAHINDKEINDILTDMVFTNFICPAVVSPDLFGISDAPISENARFNLIQIGQILQMLALMKHEEIDGKYLELIDMFNHRNVVSELMEQLLETEYDITVSMMAIPHQNDFGRGHVLVTQTELNIFIDFFRNVLDNDGLIISGEDRQNLGKILDRLPDKWENMLNGGNDVVSTSKTLSTSLQQQQHSQEQLSHHQHNNSHQSRRQQHNSQNQTRYDHQSSPEHGRTKHLIHLTKNKLAKTISLTVNNTGINNIFDSTDELLNVNSNNDNNNNNNIHNNNNNNNNINGNNEITTYLHHNGVVSNGCDGGMKNINHQNHNEFEYEQVLVIPITINEENKFQLLTEQEVLNMNNISNQIEPELNEKNIDKLDKDNPDFDSGVLRNTRKQTRFSLSNDDQSIGNASDNLEAVSEAPSNHSVTSSLEMEENDQNLNDNLSDMVSANVSGRGSPNISGRDTPSSQVTEGETNQIPTPQMTKILNKARSDIVDKFCKFEIKKSNGGDETISIISDTWSTDVLASDSETIESSDRTDRNFSTPLLPSSVILPGDINFTSQLRANYLDTSETRSESAWSTDVLASDSEKINENDLDDNQSITARSDITDSGIGGGGGGINSSNINNNILAGNNNSSGGRRNGSAAASGRDGIIRNHNSRSIERNELCIRIVDDLSTNLDRNVNITGTGNRRGNRAPDSPRQQQQQQQQQNSNTTICMNRTTPDSPFGSSNRTTPESPFFNVPPPRFDENILVQRKTENNNIAITTATLANTTLLRFPNDDYTTRPSNTITNTLLNRSPLSSRDVSTQSTLRSNVMMINKGKKDNSLSFDRDSYLSSQNVRMKRQNSAESSISSNHSLSFDDMNNNPNNKMNGSLSPSIKNTNKFRKSREPTATTTSTERVTNLKHSNYSMDNNENELSDQGKILKSSTDIINPFSLNGGNNDEKLRKPQVTNEDSVEDDDATNGVEHRRTSAEQRNASFDGRRNGISTFGTVSASKQQTSASVTSVNSINKSSISRRANSSNYENHEIILKTTMKPSTSQLSLPPSNVISIDPSSSATDDDKRNIKEQQQQQQKDEFLLIKKTLSLNLKTSSSTNDLVDNDLILPNGNVGGGGGGDGAIAGPSTRSTAHNKYTGTIPKSISFDVSADKNDRHHFRRHNHNSSNFNNGGNNSHSQHDFGRANGSGFFNKIKQGFKNRRGNKYRSVHDDFPQVSFHQSSSTSTSSRNSSSNHVSSTVLESTIDLRLPSSLHENGNYIDTTEDILAKYRRKVSSSSEATNSDSVGSSSINRKNSNSDIDSRLQNEILDEGLYYFTNAKRKLRLVLSTTDLHTADFRHTSCHKIPPLLTYLQIQLAQALNLQNLEQISYVSEAIRCVNTLDYVQQQKLLCELQQDLIKRQTYLQYLMRYRQNLLSALENIDRFEDRLRNDRQMCNRHLVMVCIRMFLEKREPIIEKFHDEFCVLTVVDEKIDFMDEFLSYLMNALRKDGILHGMANWQLDEAKICIERILLQRLYKQVMFPNEDADMSRDDVLCEHIRKLSRIISPSHSLLRIPQEYCIEAPWPFAQQQISYISAYKTPREKVQCVIRCIKSIMNMLKMASSRGTPAADDLMPVLIYVIIKSNPPYLLSTIQYVNAFIGEKLAGEDSYWWTQFCSAVTFIKTMDYGN